MLNINSVEDKNFNEENIDVNISESVQNFIKGGRDKKRIYATYTAMLEVRKELSKILELEKIL